MLWHLVSPWIVTAFFIAFQKACPTFHSSTKLSPIGVIPSNIRLRVYHSRATLSTSRCRLHIELEAYGMVIRRSDPDLARIWIIPENHKLRFYEVLSEEANIVLESNSALILIEMAVEKEMEHEEGEGGFELVDENIGNDWVETYRAKMFFGMEPYSFRFRDDSVIMAFQFAKSLDQSSTRGRPQHLSISDDQDLFTLRHQHDVLSPKLPCRRLLDMHP